MTEIVLFGITGDLSRQKLIPALFSMFLKGELSTRTSFFGFGRKTFKKDEFHLFLEECIRAKFAVAVDINKTPKLENSSASIIIEQKIREFCNQWVYVCSELTDDKGYRVLTSKLKSSGSANSCLIYVSLPPSLQMDVVEKLIHNNVIAKTSPNRRIAFEKPYGHNNTSAQNLDKFLMKNLDPTQIFRVDHYAGKQALVELEAVAQQGIFEQVLDSKRLSKIEIRLNETSDLSERGAFYDKVGALDDVLQNHVLHMLATTLVLPLSPSLALSRSMHRVAALSLLKAKTNPVKPILAQYKGYTSTRGVQIDSKTETFFDINFKLINPEISNLEMTSNISKISNVSKTLYNLWKGVDIRLMGGKALEKNEASITLFLRGSSRSIKILVNGYGTKDAYEKIFEDLLLCNRDGFIDFKQVQIGWNIVESIRRLKPKLHIYRKGSNLSA